MFLNYNSATSVFQGIAGEIISKIGDCGFEITAMTMFALEKTHAEEFLEVYRGVVQEYPSVVSELCSGPCIAMEIRAQDAARTFREFVGPADPVRSRLSNITSYMFRGLLI